MTFARVEQQMAEKLQGCSAISRSVHGVGSKGPHDLHTKYCPTSGAVVVMAPEQRKGRSDQFLIEDVIGTAS